MKVKIVHASTYDFWLTLTENQRQRLIRIADRKQTSYSLLVKSLMEKGFEEIAMVM